MNAVLDHLETIISRFSPEQRESVLADLEDLEERQAIVDESRRAEAADKKGGQL